MNIRYQRELLQQIGAGLAQFRGPGKTSISSIEVVFAGGDGNENEYRFGLPEALDALANDIYWDERGDWSGARIARVEII